MNLKKKIRKRLKLKEEKTQDYPTKPDATLSVDRTEP